MLLNPGGSVRAARAFLYQLAQENPDFARQACGAAFGRAVAFFMLLTVDGSLMISVLLQ